MIKRLLRGMLSIVLVASIVISGVPSVFAAPPAAREYPWVLKKDADGIQVSIRNVEGSAIVEYKGTVVVNADLESVIRLYEDNGRLPEWFHQCAEARRLGVHTPEDEVLYFVISMPWPVENRDLVFHRVRSKDPATGVVEYKSSSLAGIYPEQKGRVRMPYSKGLWRFTPLADGRTEIYYQQHGEVGGHIPAWLVNQLAVSLPFNSLSRFRQLLTKGKI